MLFDASEESIQTETVGTKLLKLPSDKVLELKDHYYVPNIVRNIISILMLLEQDFEIRRKDNSCSVYFFNECYENTFIDNNLLFLSLNDKIFHINQIRRKEREKM